MTDDGQIDTAMRAMFATANTVRLHLQARYDEIDVGVVLCFALALHKLPTITDADFLRLIDRTLEKALGDVRRIEAMR